jgi:hypothetical protein
LVGIFTALPAAWKSAWKLIRERNKSKEDLNKLFAEVLSAYHQRQLKEQIRREKERLERERLEAERIARPTDDQEPIVISQSLWTRPFSTLGNRMPNWRRSAQTNPLSRAEQGVDESAMRRQEKGQGS